jgi:hypothetical protein
VAGATNGPWVNEPVSSEPSALSSPEKASDAMTLDVSVTVLAFRVIESGILLLLQLFY